MISTTLDNKIIEVFKTKYLLSKEGCFIWNKSKDSKGYGIFCYKGKRVLAHRFSFITFKDKIPSDLVIDHICKNKLCVNPEHLRLLTRIENVMIGNGIPAINSRKILCNNNHPLTGNNLIIKKHKNNKLQRVCRICRNNRAKKYRLWKKQNTTA